MRGSDEFDDSEWKEIVLKEVIYHGRINIFPVGNLVSSSLVVCN